VANQGWDDEELRKELGALLVKGVAAFSLDNCERPLGGAFLCKVLSQTHVGVRILGSTRVEETISNAMPFATGDNLTTLRDMARRTLISVIDAGDRPELREFKETADAIALRRRPELVVAALTVLRAWHVLPTQEKGGVKAGPLGGYEEWIRRIAKPLVWIGQGDPSKAVERSRKTDPARKALVAVLLQWERLIGVDVPKTSKEVVDLAINDAVFYDVLVVAAGKSGKVNSYQLGAWISRYARGKSVAGITTGLLNLREATTDPSGIDRWVLRRG
jgi:putative DNA primase/helicase